MLTFKVWSGVNQIGANILELRSKKARIITDFGIPLPAQDDFEARPGESLLEGRIRLGQLPAIEGLYDESFHLPTAVLISHLHLDHMGGLAYLPASVPVFMHEESLKLYEALARYQQGYRQAHDFRPLSSGQVYSFHDFQFSFELSDHDIPGISAIFIRHGAELLVHSGDIRLHGRYPERVFALCDKAREHGRARVFIEGSSFSWSSDPLYPIQLEASESGESELPPYAEDYTFYASETELDQALDKFFASPWPGLIAVNPYLANVDRLYALQMAAAKHGRTGLWEKAAASVLQSFYPQLTLHILDLPEVESPFLAGKFGGMNPPDLLPAEAYGPGLKNIIKVKPTEVLARPDRFLLQNSFAQKDRLSLLRPILYLHTNGVPISLSSPDYLELRELLAEINCPLSGFSCNGHAEPEDLVKILNRMQPACVYPWHCGRSDYMADCLARRGFPVQLLAEGSIYTLKQ